MSDKYILNLQGEPEPCDNLLSWARMFETQKRNVKKDQIGDSKVSTVFLGLNHNYGPGEPLIWETMVFGGNHDGDCDRCGGSRADALAMHERMVAKVKTQDANPN